MSAEERAGTAPADGAAGGDASADVPVIRVERGNPTPEQLAALTVVLTAASSGSAGQREPRTSLWTARTPFARARPAVGPGGWRASSLPR